MTLKATQPGQARLLPSTFQARSELNRKYLKSLDSQNLLRPYLFEANLWSYSGSAGTTIGAKTEGGPGSWHWGWESLTCELRGHILGHWMSAAAYAVARTDDIELRAKLDAIVAELARCQEANGGQWCGPFPPKFLHNIAEEKPVWAPQYTLHKLLAGLYDVYAVLGNTQALGILTRFAEWFWEWTNPFSPEQLDLVLDWETGGMLEVWANLYGVTGDEKHRALMERYYRRRFFDRLLADEDVLTNKHANTQIPEILGAARAFEVTGEQRYADIVHAFWKSAVTERGTYCTGGGSCGEVWQPSGTLSARLHAPHEHCTVYNMMRLADYLFRWTGETVYADYWERNYLNAVLAQQNGSTGMVSYFLPLGGGSRKQWGHPTEDFWCCHGTLMQAHSNPAQAVAFTTESAIVIGQYLPSALKWESLFGTAIEVEITQDVQFGVTVGQRFSHAGHMGIQHVHNPPIPAHRPEAYVYEVKLSCEAPAEFELRLRVPAWTRGKAKVLINGEPQSIEAHAGYLHLKRRWGQDIVRIEFPASLTIVPLPDAPDTVAFMDGPLVLAGLVDEERTLHGEIANPHSLLQSDRERHHGWWQAGHYRTKNQDRGFRFVPLCEVTDETYCVYFPVRP